MVRSLKLIAMKRNKDPIVARSIDLFSTNYPFLEVLGERVIQRGRLHWFALPLWILNRKRNKEAKTLTYTSLKHG